MLNSVRFIRTSVLTVLCTGLLIGCDNPNLLKVNFDQDPGILRGSWSGTVVEECNKPFELLEWNTSSNELLAVRPYFNFSSLRNGARVSLWDTLSGNKKLEWEVPWPSEKNTEYGLPFKFVAFQNRVVAYDTRRVLVFDRSSGAALGSTNFPLAANLDLQRVSLSQNLERYARMIADVGYAYNNSGAIRAQVFKVETGQRLLDLPLNEPLMGLALNADGSWIAISLPKKGVTVYEVSSGKQLYNVPSYQSGDPSFSPDSKRLGVPKDGSFRVWKLEDGKASPTDDTIQTSINPLTITNGGCSVQLVNPDATPGQKLALETLENFPLTLELNATYGNLDHYTVSGSARFRNSTFAVEGKVNGNKDNQFIQSRGRPPQLPQAELKLLRDGVVRYTFQLMGGRGAASYFSDGYSALGMVEGEDRRFSLKLNKP